ncbi:MAG TPA: pirin-like C-terminal cupin domain-containing protein, partial [Ilumatobacteraceae bacterium]|nr:pirin-like C-terminal cupin domain-containing protein [Ilumatobacteraceae bacterium]
VYSGRPIGQPVVMGGPFVMNTRTEIDQAFRDYRAGKFGAVPRAARLQDRSVTQPNGGSDPSRSRSITSPFISAPAPTDRSNTKGTNP